MKLARYCVGRHPLFLPNAVLGLISVSFELLAMASVLPLSLMAAGEPIPPGGTWDHLFMAIGARPTFAAALYLFLGAFAARLLTHFLHQAIAVRLGKQVQAELSALAFGKVVSELSLREIDAKTSGHFVALAGDQTARAGAIIIALNQLPTAVLLVLVYLGAALALSWQLGALAIAFLAIVLVSLQGVLRKSQSLGERQLQEAKVAHSIFLDTLNGLRTVRALSAEAFVISKYGEIIRQYTGTHYAIDVLRFAARLVPAIVLLAAVALAAAAGGLRVARPAELALGMTVLAFVLRFFPAAGEVLSLGMFLLASARGASDVTHLLDAPSADGGTPGTLRLDQPLATLEFRKVGFGYSRESPVLQDFSAILRKGRSYAFVGTSGSGKTTLFDLLLGFYSPDQGEVCANGVPIRQLENRWLRAHVVLVGQQTAIFNDTIANNVRFGTDAPEPRVRAACKEALVDAFVEPLPEAYATVLSFQGNNLSGGQRQRIAIARGLLRDADVLLLDESCAGLDAETRDRVVENILRAYRDRIVVFATHDPAIMSRVHEIVKLPEPAGA